ncbi:MAG: hypothetical protein WCT49_05575 [Candidatus Paceibacterota bacterium]|jgi:hypothetical protein|nr:hypothetical protein [Candidatus Paceibacterota bacterium]
MTTKTKNIFIVISIVAISSALAWWGFGISKKNETPRIAVIETIMPPVNFGDDREFVGAADNVFVGKVIKQTGNVPRGGDPETQFSVEVIYNVKGNLQDETSVNQIGGYMNGTLFVLNEGEKPANYLLTPGSTYLFATRGDNTLVFWPYAAELLTTDKTLSNEELLKLVQNNKRILNLKIAYPDEVLMAPDISHNRTPNSFASLSSEEQEKIKVELKTIE